MLRGIMEKKFKIMLWGVRFSENVQHPEAVML